MTVALSAPASGDEGRPFIRWEGGSSLLWRYRSLRDQRDHYACRLVDALGFDDMDVTTTEIGKLVSAYLGDQSIIHPLGRPLRLDIVSIALVRDQGVNPVALMNLCGAVLDGASSSLPEIGFSVDGRMMKFSISTGGDVTRETIRASIRITDAATWNTARKDRLGSLTVPETIPHTIAQTLRGRMLRDVASHEIIDRTDLRIRGVTVGPTYTTFRFLKPAPVRVGEG